MDANTNFKAVDLLTKIANSLHDREVNPNNFLFFSAAEVKITQEWLEDFIKEIKRDCVCV